MWPDQKKHAGITNCGKHFEKFDLQKTNLKIILIYTGDLRGHLTKLGATENVLLLRKYNAVKYPKYLIEDAKEQNIWGVFVCWYMFW